MAAIQLPRCLYLACFYGLENPGLPFGMAAIQKDLIVRQLSADGEHVFAILDYQTHFEPIGDVRLAVWFRVRNDRIQTVETFYNAAVVENMLGGNLPSASDL